MTAFSSASAVWSSPPADGGEVCPERLTFKIVIRLSIAAHALIADSHERQPCAKQEMIDNAHPRAAVQPVRDRQCLIGYFSTRPAFNRRHAPIAARKCVLIAAASFNPA
jgi:hypothetical protein